MPESNIVSMYKQGYSISHIVDAVYGLSFQTHYKNAPTKITKTQAKAKVQHEIYEYLLQKNKEKPPAETDGQAI